MGDLSLQELESKEIIGSDDDRFSLALVRVGLAFGAQLEPESDDMGESELDPSGDCIDHNRVCCLEVADPIYMPSSGSDSDGG
jgi:hypothetical protein